MNLKMFHLDIIERSIDDERKEKINSFVSAIQENGFICVKVEGLEDIIRRAYEITKHYFYLPLDAKKKDTFSPMNGGGYQPLLSEVIGKIEREEAPQIEFKESLLLLGNIIKELSMPIDGFEDIAVFRKKMNEVANRILNIFQEHFQISETEKQEFDETSMYVATRLTHYPPMKDAPPNSIWCAPHFDICPFALLPRATSAGLQLQKSDGSWVDVSAPEDTIIVNPGRIFETTTAGIIKPTLHRVCTTNLADERFSIIYFPNWSSGYEIKPWNNCLDSVTRLISEEDKTKFKKSLLVGKVDHLFNLFMALAKNIAISDDQVRELAKQFPGNVSLRKTWPWAFEDLQ